MASLASPTYRHPVLPWVIKALDLAAMVAATVMTGHVLGFPFADQQNDVWAVASMVALLGFCFFPKNQTLLELPHLTSITRQAHYLIPALFAAASLQIAVCWLLGWHGRLLAELAIFWFLASVTAVGVIRGIGTIALRQPVIQHRIACNIAIIGATSHGEQLRSYLSRGSTGSVKLLGVFDDNGNDRAHCHADGDVADLIELSRQKRVNGIILALSSSDDDREKVSELGWRLRGVLSDIFVMPHLVHGPDVQLPVERIGSFSCMVLRRRPLTEWQSVGKHAIDISIAVVALILLLPLLAVVACAIKLDSSGPILFRQPRCGHNNREFVIFKFRSMYADMSDVHASTQTARTDPRVTRIGKWLRKLSIDELPQLLNVLRGDMSLVGPRPHTPHTRADGLLLDDALAEYMIRHQVKPGITGWAQVNGARGELVTLEDLRRRVSYDLDYIKNWSIALDFKIMGLTVMREVLSRHAF